MKSGLKNIFSVLMTSAVIAACGDSGGKNNVASSEDTSATSTLSIADARIRPQVGDAFKSAIVTVMSETDKTKQEAAARKMLSEYKALLGTSTDPQERELLQMITTALDKALEIEKISDESERIVASHRIFAELVPEQRAFMRKYIQSDQLRNLILQIQDVSRERSELVLHPEKKAEMQALEGKSKELAKQMIALYDNPDLDAQTRAEFAALDDIGLLSKAEIESLRRFAASEPMPQLSSGAPSLSEKASLRSARRNGAEVDFSQLTVSGVSGTQVKLSLPIHLKLKGSFDGSKSTQDLTGVAVYKFNNTLVGLIHGYANESNNPNSYLNHHESSAVISQLFGKAYIEGQVGFVKSETNRAEVKGERYQIALGYDFEAVTPFVQATVRNLNNLTEQAAYAGCEFDIMNVVTNGYTVSGHLTLKGGYHSFKGSVGSVEGLASLELNSGLNIQAGLNVSNQDTPHAKLSFSLNQ